MKLNIDLEMSRDLNDWLFYLSHAAITPLNDLFLMLSLFFSSFLFWCFLIAWYLDPWACCVLSHSLKFPVNFMAVLPATGHMCQISECHKMWYEKFKNKKKKNTILEKNVCARAHTFMNTFCLSTLLSGTFKVAFYVFRFSHQFQILGF